MPNQTDNHGRGVSLPHREAGHFIILSGCGWLLDLFLLFFLIQAVGWPLEAANLASSLIAAAFVYHIAHDRIHGGARHGRRTRLATYLCYTLGVIILASFLLGVVGSLYGKYLTSTWLVALLAKISITPPQLICNYLVSRFIARFSFG